MRVGFGYDSHRLEKGRRLVIGGVEIPFEKGLHAHSDGDVLIHAIIDALLGGAGLGDIGKHFPDTDPLYRDISSITLLRNIISLVRDKGYEVVWVDSTIICEQPKLAAHIEAMKDALSGAGLDEVNIKAKTNEGMGPVGRGEGIAAYAVCLIKKNG